MCVCDANWACESKVCGCKNPQDSNSELFCKSMLNLKLGMTPRLAPSSCSVRLYCRASTTVSFNPLRTLHAVLYCKCTTVLSTHARFTVLYHLAVPVQHLYCVYGSLQDTAQDLLTTRLVQ